MFDANAGCSPPKVAEIDVDAATERPHPAQTFCSTRICPRLAALAATFEANAGVHPRRAYETRAWRSLAVPSSDGEE
jgi:hypothetical protein